MLLSENLHNSTLLVKKLVIHLTSEHSITRIIFNRITSVIINPIFDFDNSSKNYFPKQVVYQFHKN